ncbi:MAG: SRPBCC family protein [Verrucomicrobia bacterium]|nr:MAG: SRPBCC family protein [Verrucomicrobiota bacterium]
MMEISFHAELWLPRSLPDVFAFFADAHNLEVITPSWVRFQVLTPDPIVTRPGALIDYRIRIHGFPVRWRTEITEWNPPHGFVDVQRRGPYALWHHTHTFREQDGGTFCGDEVRYRPRGGLMIDWLFVRRDVARIFVHRQRRLRELLGGAGTHRQPPGEPSRT